MRIFFHFYTLLHTINLEVCYFEVHCVSKVHLTAYHKALLYTNRNQNVKYWHCIMYLSCRASRFFCSFKHALMHKQMLTWKEGKLGESLDLWLQLPFKNNFAHKNLILLHSQHMLWCLCTCCRKILICFAIAHKTQIFKLILIISYFRVQSKNRGREEHCRKSKIKL